MHKFGQTLVVAGALVAAIAAPPAIYAHDSQGANNSSTAPATMHQAGMKGMMDMMGRMGAMMDNCSQMMGSAMGGGATPNEQWRERAPAAPDKKH